MLPFTHAASALLGARPGSQECSWRHLEHVREVAAVDHLHDQVHVRVALEGSLEADCTLAPATTFGSSGEAAHAAPCACPYV